MEFIKEILTKKDYIERIKDQVIPGQEFNVMAFTNVMFIEKKDGTTDYALNIGSVEQIPLKQDYIVIFNEVPLVPFMPEFHSKYWVAEGEIVKKEEKENVM